ncbi:MAG: hypothetical protein KKA07_13290 [Bacteroidetes bacterium]|nr:hypothetical protein [Bacteroidota bacterium]MBU1720034.1 hypothetical protein [Bacteroidota bacterium]
MIKAESMTWHFTCSSCGNTASIWEIGGVRYKASGKPLVSIKCPKCGRIAMQSIKKSDAT